MHVMDRDSSVRRSSGTVLLLVIASLLAACGGGGGTGPNSAILEWDAVTDPNISGYRIYVGTASETYLLSQDVGTDTTYTVTGLGSGTYYFAATAYDASNNESTYSNEITRSFP